MVEKGQYDYVECNCNNYSYIKLKPKKKNPLLIRIIEKIAFFSLIFHFVAFTYLIDAIIVKKEITLQNDLVDSFIEAKKFDEKNSEIFK